MSRKQEIDPKDAKLAKEPRNPCPVTRTEFRKHAKPIDIVINGQPFQAMPRVFSTQGFGYHLNPKIVLMVGDVPMECQVGLNITGIKSKEAKD